MFRRASSISPLLADHGLTVNTDKSFITRYLTDGLFDPPNDFQIQPDGLIILGVPTGTSHYTRTQVQWILSDISDIQCEWAGTWCHS